MESCDPLDHYSVSASDHYSIYSIYADADTARAR